MDVDARGGDGATPGLTLGQAGAAEGEREPVGVEFVAGAAVRLELHLGALHEAPLVDLKEALLAFDRYGLHEAKGKAVLPAK